MLTLFKTNTKHAINDLKSSLTKQLQDLLISFPTIDGNLGFIRYELTCDDLNGFSWLNNQETPLKFYWANRNQEFTMAGIGSADVVSGDDQSDIQNVIQHIEESLSENNPNLRYYGGISFQKKIVGDEWKNYHSYQFNVPQFEILKDLEGTLFACNIATSNLSENFITSLIDDLNQINFKTTTSYRNPPEILNRQDFPSKEEWKGVFNKTKAEAFKYDKIVLARRSVFEFDKAIKPEALLKHLADITPNCYH
ncbi:MAG: menaquinone-specific isochorismate synthase, partial [Lysobacterales bacterium]